MGIKKRRILCWFNIFNNGLKNEFQKSYKQENWKKRPITKTLKILTEFFMIIWINEFEISLKFCVCLNTLVDFFPGRFVRGHNGTFCKLWMQMRKKLYTGLDPMMGLNSEKNPKHKSLVISYLITVYKRTHSCRVGEKLTVFFSVGGLSWNF
jgi:hypothetical protein